MKRGKDLLPPISERLIVLNHDDATCDIHTIDNFDSERILAGHSEISIPFKDAKQYISPLGRVFIVNAPEWYVTEAKHLAEVEQATVIAQAVNYQKPGAATSKPGGLMTFLPWILVVFAIIFALVKK